MRSKKLFLLFFIFITNSLYAKQDAASVYKARAAFAALWTGIIGGSGVLGFLSQWHKGNYSLRETMCAGTLLAVGLYWFSDYCLNTSERTKITKRWARDRKSWRSGSRCFIQAGRGN